MYVCMCVYFIYMYVCMYIYIYIYICLMKDYNFCLEGFDYVRSVSQYIG